MSYSSLRKLSAYLKKGGLLAYPTESCYGLGCIPTSVRAVRRLVRLKKRPQHKGMIVIGANLKQLKTQIDVPSNEIEMLLEREWPAPKTFLLPAKKNVLSVLRGSKRNKLAVRVPAHEAARYLCKALNTPLVSTSCNRAGKRPCKTEREVRRQFGRDVRIIRGLIGKQKQPSQIIDALSGKRLR